MALEADLTRMAGKLGVEVGYLIQLQKLGIEARFFPQLVEALQEIEERTGDRVSFEQLAKVWQEIGQSTTLLLLAAKMARDFFGTTADSRLYDAMEQNKPNPTTIGIDFAPIDDEYGNGDNPFVDEADNNYI